MSDDTCRSCSAPVRFVETVTGRTMPICAPPPGMKPNVIVEDTLTGPLARVVKPGEGTHVSHFATCPNADRWRRG